MPPSTSLTKGLTSREVLKALLDILHDAEKIPVPDMALGAQWAFYIEHAMKPPSVKGYVQAGLIPYLHDILKRFSALDAPLELEMASNTAFCGAR